jgi:hypothetical protein
MPARAGRYARRHRGLFYHGFGRLSVRGDKKRHKNFWGEIYVETAFQKKNWAKKT